MMSVRGTLRRQIRSRRRAIAPTERRRAARTLIRLALGSGILARRRRIGFYVPADGEIDVLPLLHRVDALGRECYLPVLDALPYGRLRFRRWRPGDRFCFNRYGIAEPTGKPGAGLGAAALDLLLMPLVAFDDSGNRLGMGAGYYDRTLAFLATRRPWRRPLLCGAAYEIQHVAALDAAPWDIPLDMCITDRRLHLF
jgi:5-formyltetrahydrofolate cyclo-ligase